MNIMDYQFEGLAGAADLLKFAQENLLRRQEAALKDASDEVILQSILRDPLGYIYYALACASQEFVIAEEHRDSDEIYITQAICKRYLPNWEQILQCAVSALIDMSYSFDEILTASFSTERQSVNLVEIEDSFESWSVSYMYVANKNFSFFGLRVLEVIKKNHKVVIENLLEQCSSGDDEGNSMPSPLEEAIREYFLLEAGKS